MSNNGKGNTFANNLIVEGVNFSVSKAEVS